MESGNSSWKKFAVARGRARRKEYWIFYFMNQAIIILLALSIGLIYEALAWELYSEFGYDEVIIFFGAIFIIPTIVLLFGIICATIRRLHDTNRSGWWMLITLMPILGSWTLFIFTLTEGDRGPNDYGPDPKANLEDRELNADGPDPKASHEIGNSTTAQNIDFEGIKKLKDFLDNGTITQVDYDAKKKEMLHL